MTALTERRTEMNIDNITGTAYEPTTLTEIADVTFESNRLVLRVTDPIKAKKFGLSDKVWKYEFDGGTMYWFDDKDESKPSSWDYSCGKGSWTIVADKVERTTRAVKDEMAKQIMLKGMLEYFGNAKRFTGVAIGTNAFVYNKDGTLRSRQC